MNGCVSLPKIGQLDSAQWHATCTSVSGHLQRDIAFTLPHKRSDSCRCRHCATCAVIAHARICAIQCVWVHDGADACEDTRWARGSSNKLRGAAGKVQTSLTDTAVGCSQGQLVCATDLGMVSSILAILLHFRNQCSSVPREESGNRTLGDNIWQPRCHFSRTGQRESIGKCLFQAWGIPACRGSL